MTKRWNDPVCFWRYFWRWGTAARATRLGLGLGLDCISWECLTVREWLFVEAWKHAIWLNIPCYGRSLFFFFCLPPFIPQITSAFSLICDTQFL